MFTPRCRTNGESVYPPFGRRKTLTAIAGKLTACREKAGKMPAHWLLIRVFVGRNPAEESGSAESSELIAVGSRPIRNAKLRGRSEDFDRLIQLLIPS
jgi:hypothetical protein